ncbi:DUF302 domain-containing protein [uncultured Pseudosulfitobacter sp.]|uniref:DUF302 domain-containing protein n=1 Tax=uncultured Pseudosulfitobacter sp. TaxID=2854214 RepID=UPI0030DB3A83|tara:strand:+ start:354 stop:809 length:456 start_codon:yes stop_codon:yes gene_type:complete
MRFLIALLMLSLPAFAEVADITARDGWAVVPTGKPYDQLVADVKTAAKAHQMGIVTEAGPTGAAATRGITIPGNRVIGLFNNALAVQILNIDTHAMIEAPIRVYVTENADGTATLSYKLPSAIYAPYSSDLTPVATELDATFAAIAAQAAN